MKVVVVYLVLLTCPLLQAREDKDAVKNNNNNHHRAKRQVKEETGIVSIPDVLGGTPPPTAGPIAPATTPLPTTADYSGFFGFNFPFGFGNNNGQLFGNSGGGFGSFPSFPTPRPPGNDGFAGVGTGFPPLSGGGFLPGNANGGGNLFPDFGFGSGGGNPGIPSFNNQQGSNRFTSFPGFTTRAAFPVPSDNQPVTTAAPAASSNICTPPVFTPLADRVSNTTIPPNVQTLIDQELNANQQLRGYLDLASNINGSPVKDSGFENTDLTCPSSTYRATVFQRYGTNCWILQQNQQPFYYATCHCNQCLAARGFGQPPGSICEPHTMLIAVFAFCENGGQGSQTRITQERISLPVTCRCRHAAPAATQAPASADVAIPSPVDSDDLFVANPLTP